MRSILVVIDRYYPFPTSGAKLIHELVQDLVARGHSVTVVTTADFPGVSPRSSMQGNVRVIEFNVGKLKNVALYIRGINELFFTSNIWRDGRHLFQQMQFDLIICYSPTIFLSGLIHRLKKLFGCPSYLIQRDLFPNYLLDVNLIKPGPLYYFLKMKEYELYEVCDAIGAESPSNLKYCISQGYGFKSRLLYNWIDRSGSVAPMAPWRNGKFVFFYGGIMGHGQNVLEIAKVAEMMQGVTGVVFRFVGGGDEKQSLIDYTRQRSINNIEILDAVSQERFDEFVLNSDVGLVSLNRELRMCNIPGKLMNYLLKSKPVLAAVGRNPDLTSIIEGNGVGFVSLNGDVERLYSNAMKICTDHELYSRMSRRCLGVIDKYFSISVAVHNIAEHLGDKGLIG